MVDPKRRGLLTSISSAIHGTKGEGTFILRPPYNADPTLFQTICPTCETKACVKACEERIILIDEKGAPTLTFKARGCTFCDACATACEADVLSDTSLQYIPTEVTIDPLRCVAWHDVVCTSCKDPCLDDAIRFLGLFRPEIDDSRCTGCGWCAGVCPSDAIQFSAPKNDRKV